MAKNKAVVVGALGVIGRKLIETLGRRDDWEIVGLSRRTPDFDSRASYISVDLLDRADAEAKLAGLTDVTHVFYCAFRSEEHTSELQSLMRTSYAVFCLKKKKPHH